MSTLKHSTANAGWMQHVDDEHGFRVHSAEVPAKTFHVVEMAYLATAVPVTGNGTYTGADRARCEAKAAEMRQALADLQKRFGS